VIVLADIQTLSIVLAAVSVIIAATNSIISSRKADQQRQTEIDTRQAELFMQLYNRYITPEFRAALTEMLQWSWTDFDDFLEKYGPDTNPTAHNLHISTENVFEGIGVMVARGLIDISMVVDLIWFALGNYWERFGPIWEGWRAQTGHKNLADHTEALYHQIQQIIQPSTAFTYTRKERKMID
jgi:hypothetical protein